VHEPQVIHDIDAIVAVCKKCRQMGVFRMDKDGRFNNREYTKFFKIDLLQPSENLYWKYRQSSMAIL